MPSLANRSQQNSTVPAINTNIGNDSDKDTERNSDVDDMDHVTDRSSPYVSSVATTSRDTDSRRSSSCRKKTAISSKEIIHNLFNAWQPQLSSSYRPHVSYVPTDFTQLRGYTAMSHRPMSGLNSVTNAEKMKFKAAERVVEACNLLNNNILTNRSNHSRRPSYVKI